MADEAETLARRWFREVWTERRRSAIYELMTEDAIGHSPTGVTHGYEDWVKGWERLTGAFPDIKVTVEDVLSDGRNAVVRWRARMTHTGEHLGVAPSGRVIDTHGLTWLVVKRGRIVEGWDGWDATAVLAACGAATHLTGAPVQ